jgi:uncharacterized protein YqjF (DUF2071 family)
MHVKPFLTGEWRNLLMANYEVDPASLKKFLPAHTEPDTFNGKHYASLVGFLFTNTRVQGWAFPFHKTFEEVNLRFYVRYKENTVWKRGVVFIKEIVPKMMISLVANAFYNEHYVTHRMKHSWTKTEEEIQVAYYWKIRSEWNFLQVTANLQAQPIVGGSEEEFITEHYWGYTSIDNNSAGEYEVKHPKWRVHHVNEYKGNCNIRHLYGSEFVEALTAKPSSVFLAEGSAIEVMKGRKIQ